MELIAHDKFIKLKLKGFAKGLFRVMNIDNYIALNHRAWHCESCLFIEFLRKKDDPEKLKCIHLSWAGEYSESQKQVYDKLIKRINFPIEYGMQINEVISILAEPVKTYEEIVGTEQMSKRYLTHVFEVGKEWQYSVECRMKNSSEILAITIETKD